MLPHLAIGGEDVATTLGVDAQWVSGFLDGFAQEPESSTDGEYIQGYLTRRGIADDPLPEGFARPTMTSTWGDLIGLGDDGDSPGPISRIKNRETILKKLWVTPLPPPLPHAMSALFSFVTASFLKNAPAKKHPPGLLQNKKLPIPSGPGPG